MKNTLSITSDCVCTCVDSIADGTNRIFAELNVGDVSAPVLMIWKNGDLQSTIQLYANMLNTVEIPSVFFSAGCTITFAYSHTGYTGKTFTINFPDKLDGNLSVKMQSDYVYSAKYTVIGGGGSVDPYILPPAKADTLGGIMVGDNLTIDESGRLSATAAPDPYTLPPATAGSLGGVIVGDNLTVEQNGRVSAPAPYELPKAGKNTLGGVKVGSGLTISSEGKLSATNTAALNYSTEEQIVGTWTDGKPLYQRTIFGESVQSWGAWVDTGIVIPNVGIFMTGDKGIVDPADWDFIEDRIDVGIVNSTGMVRVKQGISTNSVYFSYYVTIRYTKTTD